MQVSLTLFWTNIFLKKKDFTLSLHFEREFWLLEIFEIVRCVFALIQLISKEMMFSDLHRH